jgi:hypothetical protein
LQHARKEDNKLYSYLENKGMNIKFKDWEIR